MGIRKTTALKRGLNVLIVLLAAGLILALSMLSVYKKMGLTLCTVNGTSMEPTLSDGARLLLNPEKEMERFDIAVFQDGGRYLVKRVVGFPGDDVTVLDGNLFVNGEMYHEPYLDEDHTKKFREQDFKVHVPEGQYFALGDNRDKSLDSRNIGMIESSQFVGVAIFGF